LHVSHTSVHIDSIEKDSTARLLVPARSVVQYARILSLFFSCDSFQDHLFKTDLFQSAVTTRLVANQCLIDYTSMITALYIGRRFFLTYLLVISCLQCFETVGWASGRASACKKLSDEVLVWLSVWNEVQIVCI